MSGEWTLPLVQEHLDALPSGAQFSLAERDMVRLFGLNDIAARRIANFARGHSCRTLFSGEGVIFQKLPPLHRPAAG